MKRSMLHSNRESKIERWLKPQSSVFKREGSVTCFNVKV